MEDPLLLKAVEELRKNDKQWDAFESKDNFVVLAGPGSGKTKLLVTKMAVQATQIASPRGTACITYNNECVRELLRKLRELGVRPGRTLFVGTAHSFCLQHLIRPFASLVDTGLPTEFVVASGSDQEEVLQAAMDQILPYPERAANYRISFDWYRHTYLDREADEWHESDKFLPAVINLYEENLHSRGQVDFDDMVLAGLRLIRLYPWVRRVIAARFPLIFVDEYQDLGPALHELTLAFLASGMKVFAVGDPDQSIYGFTGASPQLLTDLANRDDVKSTRLELNYRSKQVLVDGSVAVLGEPRDYREAPRDGDDPDKPVIEFVECPKGIEQQADVILDKLLPDILAVEGRAIGDVAVLYPNRNIGDVIASAADTRGIPYIRIDQGAPYQKVPFTRWLEDCAAWCGGGWLHGDPGLGPILDWWATFVLVDQPSSASEHWRIKVSLTRFLWNHRGADEPLREWIEKFWAEVLEEHVATRPDELASWAKLSTAAAQDGPFEKWSVAIFGGQVGSPDHLNLITLHSAKGREFDAVIMMGMDQGVIPSWAATSEGAKREPRRLFYVGMTRARYRIYMTYSGFNVAANGTVHRNGPSEFLLQLREAVG